MQLLLKHVLKNMGAKQETAVNMNKTKRSLKGDSENDANVI